MPVCPKCQKTFEKKGRNFIAHVKFCGQRYSCPHCPETCSNPSNLTRHIRNNHPETLFEGTKRAAEEVLAEPSPKKLIVEDMVISPPPMFKNNVSVEEFSFADLIVPPPSPLTEPINPESSSTKQKWCDYQGMTEQDFNNAVDQLGGKLPLFEFEVADVPTKGKKAFNRLTKNIFSAQLHQRREPEEEDNIGVALALALETAAQTQLKRMMEKEHLPEDSKVYFSMTPQGFPRAFQTKETSVKKIMDGTLRTDQLFRKMAGKLNSNESFGGNQTFQMDMIVLAPKFTGRGNGKRLNPGRTGYKHSRHTKRCIVEIKNKDEDELCCARAIVTMQAHAEWKVLEKQIQIELSQEAPNETLLEQLYLKEKKAHQKYKNMRQGRDEQERLAKHLHKMASVPEGPCGLPELQQFQAYLYTLSPPYQLKVVEDVLKKPIYMGKEKVDEDNILLLIHSPDHYDGCTSLSGFFNKSYWCHDCDRAFNTNDWAHHSCRGRVCKACHVKNCPDKHPGKPTLPCSDCHGLFYGPSCLQAHREKKGKHQRSVCEQWHTCPDCCATYNTKIRHKCGVAACCHCKQFVKLDTHQCYIQPDVSEDCIEDLEENELDPTEELEEALAEGKKKLPPLFVYADIETMTVKEGDVKRFVPNLLCYQTSEEENIHSLTGEKICQQFIQCLNKLSNKKCERPVIVLFHNLKGFDGVFIMEELYTDGRKLENQFGVGSKVFSFESGALLFKDSLCFLNFPLSQFPKTFGLTELKKGFFPHAFNTPDHQYYRGPIPEKSYYDPESMKPDVKKEFDTWYVEQERRQEQEGYVYDFQKELEAYCQSDVQLLKEGSETFVKQFQEEADFNPFEKCITIAAACNKYWRRSDAFPENQIAARPPRGWHGAQTNQSLVALEWLAYEESQLEKQPGEPERIQHVRNGGERTLRVNGKQYKVDGYDNQTKTIYEFYGCLWHGCKQCYRNKRDVSHVYLNARTLEEVYQATQVKATRLREAGYKLVELWECQWSRMKRENPTIQRFVEQLQRTAPLQPRDAFFGGRTGAVCLYDQTVGDEEIMYADVTSLYPWVNKTKAYPIGHPQIFSQPSQDIHQYFGIAKVTVLPPKELYHPVLPMKIKHQGMEKLTFPLCNQCVIDEQEKPLLERSAICFHSDAQRQLTGTWCTPEIEQALEKGYTLIALHEVWHFPQQRTGLFADYVNTWLKRKTEAGGWPKWCNTEEKKQAFVRSFKEQEDITLDTEKIVSNPGLKETAKLMLNSFWGKFGQRENLQQVYQCTSEEELYSLTEDDTKEILTMRIFSEHIVDVVYKSKEGAITPSSKTNVFVAAFTTCWARLKLYSYLDTLQERVLYYDTDSVVYKWSPGQTKLPTGDFLGQLKDELGGDIIEEFVSGGAKNYSYRTRGGKYVCKVRGFTMDTRTMKQLNFESMKNLILKELSDPQEAPRKIGITNPKYFDRDMKLKQIFLTERTKQYGLVFDKRVIVPGCYQSVPYGYYRDDNVNLLMDLA